MRSTLTPVAECTVPEKILLAALELEDEGQSPFSAEALIVKVWQKYPKTFGLKGFADQHPDSNKVLSSIMGVKGLAGRGWLSKVGQKLYTLTREGRQLVRRLLHDDPTPLPVEEVAKISRDQEKLLNVLWASSAYEKYQEGRKGELTFADACGFWGISESVRGAAVNARLEQLRAEMSSMVRLLTTSDATLSNGRAIVLADLNRLSDIDQNLEERFSRHLNLLRSRASGRV
jgi:hypothetical protein